THLDGHVRGVVHRLPETGAGKSHQFEAVPRWRFLGDERVRGVDAEPRLRGSCGRPATQPRELLAEQVGAACIAGGLHPLTFGAGENVSRVAALVRMHVAAGDLPGRGAYLVEEPPVGGHD